MHRISRDRLFHRIISDIKFERRLSIGLKNEQIYALAERFCELVCSDGTMVVGADMPGFSHGVPGKFGADEPWPEWANKSDLIMEGLVKEEPAAGQGEDGVGDRPTSSPRVL